MDFIQRKLTSRIACDSENAFILRQVRLEYTLIYLFSYFFNKNIDRVGGDVKSLVFESISKPTIGEISRWCSQLDCDKELKKSKIADFLVKYPSYRNKKIGHGYTFSDKIEDAIQEMDAFYDIVSNAKAEVLRDDYDFIQVQKIEQDVYHGLRYSVDGDPSPWSCPKESCSLEVGHVYISNKINQYFKISPFIYIDNFGTDVYCYSNFNVQNGEFFYNHLLKTESLKKTWMEFAHFKIEKNKFCIITPNGTIKNIYENNYRRYIDIGIKSEIKTFLSNNTSAVCAKIWGHGGVGKTATVQSICEDFGEEEKRFDYIVFLSAKDRRYDYYNNVIEKIEGGIVTCQQIIEKINAVMFDEEVYDVQRIKESQKKLLLVIDDFETFAKEEQEKIGKFIDDNLNVLKHKVIITTRAAGINITAKEYKTSELTEEKTIEFLDKILSTENPRIYDQVKEKLKQPEIRIIIHRSTSGRPLHILYFCTILCQKGLDFVLQQDLSDNQAIKNFLYDRLYDCLSPKAKDAFVIVGLLVTPDDLNNAVSKVKYIANMEDDDDEFEVAMQELEKLRIIKIDDERKFFDVYSPEILEMMRKIYVEQPRDKKGMWESRRLQMNSDKEYDINRSLLKSANNDRMYKSEREVSDKYKFILNRTRCPLEIKIEAIKNLVSYLIIARGKRQEGLKILSDYNYLFALPQNKPIYSSFTLIRSQCSDSDVKQNPQVGIDIIAEYFSKCGFSEKSQIDLDLFARLLFYKEKKFFSDKKRNPEEGRRLYVSHGQQLLNYVKDSNMEGWTKGTKQSVLTAMNSLVNVLDFSKMTPEAIDVCTIFAKIPSFMAGNFSKKKNLLEMGKFDPDFQIKKPNKKSFIKTILKPRILKKRIFQDETFAIYVGNLPHECEEQELMKLFMSIGRISSIKVVKNQSPKVYGFVNFCDESSCEKAVAIMNGVTYKGHTLVVNKQ